MKIIENNNDDLPFENDPEYLNSDEMAQEDFPQEEISENESVDYEYDYETEPSEENYSEETENQNFGEIEEIYSDSSLDPALNQSDGNDNEAEENEAEENETEENLAEVNDYEYDSEGEESEEDGEENSQSPENTDGEKVNFFLSIWKNKRRRAKAAYALVCALLVIVGTGYGFVNAMLDKVEDDTPFSPENVGEEIVYDEDDYELFSAVSSAGSVNDYIDQWYDSGEAMSSKNVINVLLVGLDSENGLKTGDSRSDTMMIVSLNTKTKKISMVSLFRDTWAKYIPSDGVAQYGKMNGAYRYGGIKCTVETIEKMFKTKIDHYAIVDFTNFIDLVNAVGGVDLYVQEYESRNMMKEWGISVGYSADENDLIHLDGEQAFWFARQRHCDADADVSRTRRQRQVITAFINSCKGASFSQISDALNDVFSFVKTDLKKTEILGYAAKALAWGWIKYPIDSVKISDNSVFQTPTLFGASIVIQDYPKVASIIQKALYGTSNIVLEEGRRIIFSLY